MLNNFLLSIQAVLPMFLIMAMGIYIRKARMITEEQVKVFNKVIFKICFPCLMFSNIYGKNISGANVRVLGYTLMGVLIIYVLATMLVCFVEKNNKSRGAMIQAIYRSNVVIMGMSMVQNIFGNDVDISVTAILITIVVPVYNILAVITLEVYRGEKPNAMQILKSIFKNPIIVGALVGIVAVLLRIRIPEFITGTITSVSNSASPMALLMLGASFNIKSLSANKRNLIICVIGRLIGAPLIGVILLCMAGIRGIPLITAVAIFASPVSVTSYTMAQQMDSDSELAADCVIASSIFSCFTMFLWVFILKSLEMF